jgi:hypothetical protein
VRPDFGQSLRPSLKELQIVVVARAGGNQQPDEQTDSEHDRETQRRVDARAEPRQRLM